MEFLDKIVIPQSPHHIELLQYLMSFTFLIFLPYLGLLLGATFMSVVFHKRGLQSNNSNFVKFAKDLIDIVTVTKSAAFALGLVPLLSLTFAYAQLLQGSGGSVSGNLLFSILILFLGIVAVYIYKYTFFLKHIFSVIEVKDDEDAEKELDKFKATSNKLLLKSGPFALVLLLLASFFIIGSIHFAGNSTAWLSNSSLLSILFSVEALTYYLQFLAASFAIASIGFLYVRFKPGSEYAQNENDYTKFAKGLALKTALLFTLAQPVLYALNLMSMPKVSLSGQLFFAAIFVLGFLLVIANMLYFMIKENHLKYRANVLFVTLLLFSVMVVKDQLAFSTSAQLQFKQLGVKYARYTTEFKESLGIEAVVVSGEDIFNGRCIACHRFDTKLVGPAYNDILPKYDGKMDELIKFITNPVKVDPAFTAMPNQGLKPNEAKAIAEYLMKTYKGE